MSRRVRVTVEGDATESPAHGVLRVYVGASRCVMVDPSWSGVSVEDVAPPRVWTDGDVAQGLRYVWTRHRGQWHTPAELHALDDHEVTEGVDGCEGWTALRYQAGE